MMNIGIVGTKQGMTRLFTEAGTSIPVTVVSVFPNIITQVKTDSIDGYNSVQVTFGSKKEKHLTKSELGHFNKFKTPPGEGLWELQIESEDLENLTPGNEIGLDQFEIGQKNRYYWYF